MKLTRWAPRLGAALLAAGAMAAGVVAAGGSVANAAVPDRAGFVLFAGGVAAQAAPAGSTVSPGAVPGRWVVRFPGQGIAGGVVHVTAVHDAVASPPARWCQAESWSAIGVDEVVKVACYTPGGGLDAKAGFSVQFSRSSGPVAGGLYGYVDSTPAGAIITQYNSVGAANTVTHAGVGLYSVAFIGLGTPSPNAGSLQVTAVNAISGARCKVGAWSSSPNGQFLRILCHNPAGALADNRFTVTYQYRRSLFGPISPPSRVGYLWSAPPLGPALTNFNTSGVLNALAGAGPWTATYPNLASSPGNMQVTAYGTGSQFCNLSKPWNIGGASILANINCFTNAGVPTSTGFFASYTSRY